MSSGLRSVDPRENMVGEIGIRSPVETLERSARVWHVYVHNGGKIEALGTMDQSQNQQEAKQPMMKVSTVCVVDIRKNKPSDQLHNDGGDLVSFPYVCFRNKIIYFCNIIIISLTVPLLHML